MNLKNKLGEITNLIIKGNRFLITSHVSPDGDNLGSVIALKLALEQLGKEVLVVIDDTVPDCFSFLPTIKEIKEYNKDLELQFDTCFLLDCSDLDRIDRVNELIGDEKIINIDHHNDNDLFGDYNIVEEVAATGELIYQLIIQLQNVELTKDIATALATALITDTGSFRYSNTTSRTHRIMAKLLDYNVDTAMISKEVFGTNSYQNLILRGKVLQGLHIDDTKKVAWLKVSQQLLDDIGATLDDTEGLVNYPRSLEGVEVGILFKEVAEEEIRVSLRSNYYCKVNQVAHQFNGGGHPRAAGCTVNDTLVEAEKKVVAAVKEELGGN